MNNIKRCKAWPELRERGFVMVTYRFNDRVCDYGAMLTDKAGKLLIDIKPFSHERNMRWTVVVDPSLIVCIEYFTLNSTCCSSREILATIDKLTAGLVEVETRYEPGKGRVPVYAGSWPG